MIQMIWLHQPSEDSALLQIQESAWLHPLGSIPLSRSPCQRCKPHLRCQVVHRTNVFASLAASERWGCVSMCRQMCPWKSKKVRETNLIWYHLSHKSVWWEMQKHKKFTTWHSWKFYYGKSHQSCPNPDGCILGACCKQGKAVTFCNMQRLPAKAGHRLRMSLQGAQVFATLGTPHQNNLVHPSLSCKTATIDGEIREWWLLHLLLQDYCKDCKASCHLCTHAASKSAQAFCCKWQMQVWSHLVTKLLPEPNSNDLDKAVS